MDLCFTVDQFSDSIGIPAVRWWMVFTDHKITIDTSRFTAALHDTDDSQRLRVFLPLFTQAAGSGLPYADAALLCQELGLPSFWATQAYVNFLLTASPRSAHTIEREILAILDHCRAGKGCNFEGSFVLGSPTTSHRRCHCDTIGHFAQAILFHSI